MRNYIKKSFIIKESNLDCYNKLSYFELMKMLEEVAGLHSASMVMSMSDLKNKDNGSWVISKIKIDFAGEFPVSGEKLQVFSYPTKPTLIKNERNFVLNVNGKPFANVCSVWCIIDIDTRKSILTTKLNSLPKNFKFHKNELDNTIYELILGECSIQDCILKEVIPGSFGFTFKCKSCCS